MPDPDIDRLKKEYARRFDQEIDKNLYSSNDPAYEFYVQRFKKALVDLFTNMHILYKENRLILEIGCGSGGTISQLISLGVQERSLIGIDILLPSLHIAKARFPQLKTINADAQSIPFPGKSFDILLQFTAFSSILDYMIKDNMAKEMLRVLKDDGAIIWYDFWWNPKNKQTKGIGLWEVRRLFNDCDYRISRITLAPPIARRIVPISPRLAQSLERLRLFNSHYLVIIRKRHVN